MKAACGEVGLYRIHRKIREEDEKNSEGSSQSLLMLLLLFLFSLFSFLLSSFLPFPKLGDDIGVLFAPSRPHHHGPFKSPPHP